MLTGAYNEDTTLSTPVAINKGGTGQTTTQAALDALAAASGSLVQGDILIVDASLNLVRLARGTDNYVLTMNGSNPNWEAASAGVSLSDDNTWTGTNAYNANVTFGTFSAQTRAAKTISSAQITMTTNLASVDTEASASSDDLNEALGVPTSAIICLRAANADRTVVVKDTVGSVQFIMSGDMSLDSHQDTITFVNFDGTNNYELCRSDNI